MNTRLRVAAAWIAVQVGFFAVWAMTEEKRLDPGEGRSILVETAPVDPRDLLRGQYMQLSYPFSRPGQFGDELGGVREGSEVWVVLAPEGRFHVPSRASIERPEALAPDEVALLGRLERWQIVFGIEMYFVQEGTPTPDQRDITVRLRVGDDGYARIEQIYVRDQPWP